MKKLLLLLLILIPFKVNASYIVMDKNSSRILEGKDINEVKLIASTTKIMTAIIALENKNINDIVKIDSDVYKVYGSAIYIEENEELKLIDLLYGLMLRSGNDAAIQIANYVSKNEDNFVKLMNDKARELNMNNTLFINSSGLENDKGVGNTSTAKDMALLMRYALNNNTFKTIINTKKYICKSNYKTYIWNNKNKLLYDYKYNIGGKTGYTKKAKRTLVTASKKDNKELIIVTLNESNDFNLHKNLYENNFKKYKLVTILYKNLFSIKNNYKDKLFIKDNYKMLLKDKEIDNISLKYELYDIKNYNDEDVVGKVIIKLNNEEIDNIPIYIRVKKNIIKSFINKFKFWGNK